MLSSYTRMTYSLVVIMLETTSSISIFLPMMIGILTASAVGTVFTRSLYDRAIRGKQMPYLRSAPPQETRFVMAKTIMATELVTLSSISNMEACKKALQSTHNAYPVLNTAGRLVGILPKSILVKLLVKKLFYDKESTDRRSMSEHSVQDSLRDTLLINEE